MCHSITRYLKLFNIICYLFTKYIIIKNNLIIKKIDNKILKLEKW
jgi:hypothetical protein